jgi:nucleotide-binding universal stress UspA family protein
MGDSIYCTEEKERFMKIRAARRSQDVVLEMEPRNSTFPPISVAEVNLKKILVPIDFSEASRKAMQYALSFARQFNAEVLLLHVIELTPLASPSAPLPIIQDETTRATLHESAAKHLAAWRDESGLPARIKASVREGVSAHAEIVKTATEGNIDLIVLGTQGRTGLAHLLIGSTAERVVRHAPCPVLVVREREHDFVISRKATSKANVK